MTATTTEVPKHPMGGEGLEVGLDPGAAARVRAGNGQRDGSCPWFHFASEPMALLTTIRDLHRRKGRDRRGLALAEGVRLVEEMLAADAACKGAVIGARPAH